jgi:hypothetical protein
MKTIGDLPDTTDITQVRVVIPERFVSIARDAGLNSDTCYLVGSWSFGVWVKEHPGDDRMFPITGNVDALEWELAP